MATDQVPNGRALSPTEELWCQATLGGSGVVVLGISLAKNPDINRLLTALHSLQNTHPILRSRIHYNPKSSSYSFVTSASPYIQIRTIDLPTTRDILEKYSHDDKVSAYHLIVEHELDDNPWKTRSPCEDVFFATVYALPEGKWVLVMRMHLAACDRTGAVAILRELSELIGESDLGVGAVKTEITPPMEDLVPSQYKLKKTLWERGVNMIGYSVSSFRLTNLKFKDTKSPRSTQVVRLKMDFDDTQKILAGCKVRGIKLCGALAAAGVITLHGLKSGAGNYLKKKKYGVATFADCRPILQPPLSDHTMGFYYTPILNSHTVKGGENMWDLAGKIYQAYADFANSGRQFSDMEDINFLARTAIENPAVTSSSSLRSCFLAVFDNTVIDHTTEKRMDFGFEDYMGCGSISGMGPSIGICDTIRDGRLDCVCVYPAPLHSREQMLELVDGMKKVLVEAGKEADTVS